MSIRVIGCKSVKSVVQVLLVSLCIVPTAFSQKQFTVKVLDGRSGHSLKNVVIDIWFAQHASGVPRQSRTGQDGAAQFTVPEHKTMFVAAGEFIADCRGGNVAGKSFVDRNVYSVHDVLTTGTVGENHCGAATAQPTPNTLTFFLRPRRWWEKLHD
jgi:hypothetical protein